MPSNEMIAKGRFWDKGPMVVTGCTKVSRGCDRCWSEQAHVMRQGRPAWPSDCLTEGSFNGKVHFRLEALEAAVKGKTPRVISPWNDLYHEGVTLEQTGKAYRIMDNKKNSHHAFLIITKRIDRAAGYCGGVHDMTGAVLPDNIWHIATMEDQEQVDKRMPHLLRIPGKRGIIIEPIVGPIELGLNGTCPESWGHGYSPVGEHIHQVILGGETGRGAVPMHPDWVRSVRDQCASAGVPFFFKSWGEWIDKSSKDHENIHGEIQIITDSGVPDDEYQTSSGTVCRVGKRAAGRVLDGRTYDDLAWRNK